MNNSEKTILVTGATGKQGGAVTRHLLDAGFKIRAFVRDSNKPTAIDLKNHGVELFEGNLDDRDAIVDAMQDVYGVFSVQNFWEHGYEKELSQGINAADAAKLVGIKHLVYSSVASSDENTGLPHFDSKWKIEQYIHKLGVPYTIIKPVFFMDNFESWAAPQTQDGKLVLAAAMPPDKKLQMIAVDDVGAIAAIIFQNPDKYIGKTLTLAGDEISMTEAADAYADVTNKNAVYNDSPLDVVKQNNAEIAKMYKWFTDKGYSADIDKVRNIYPGLKASGHG